MEKDEKLFGLIKRLFRHFARSRKKQFLLLLLLMVVASFAEIVTIGAILPFLGVLTAPDKVFNHPKFSYFVEKFDFQSADELLLPVTIFFGVTVLIVAVVRLSLLFFQTRVSFSTGAEIGAQIFRKTLYQPYPVHIGRNSSEVIVGVYSKASTVGHGVLLPLLNIISGSFMLITVLTALVLLEPLTAIGAMLVFGSLYATVLWVSRKWLLGKSATVSRASEVAMKALQEGLGGIRDVLINGKQEVFCEHYRKANNSLCQAQQGIIQLSQSPRYVMEAVGIITIAILAYFFSSRAADQAMVVPVLGSFALGAQRLLPALQGAFQSWTALRGTQAILSDVCDLLDQPVRADLSLSRDKMLPFEREVRVSDVSFTYSGSETQVLNHIDFTVEKGERVGFVGTTGSGKSTLLDVVMGLLTPTEGYLMVDDVVIDEVNCHSWQMNIASVPQSIYLSDSSVSGNIAFGVPLSEIDHDRVVRAAQHAQISDVIDAMEGGYSAMLGERGVRLSGGQRQRIGIARALYLQASVIVFDEATSALDDQTEIAVMEAIDSLSPDLTILMIAHRVSTLKNCSKIIEITDGVITNVKVKK